MANVLILVVLILITILKCSNSYSIRKSITRSILPSSSSSSLSLMQSTISTNILDTFDYNTQSKLPWIPSGYKTYTYNNYKINYVDLGGGKGNATISLSSLSSSSSSLLSYHFYHHDHHHHHHHHHYLTTIIIITIIIII